MITNSRAAFEIRKSRIHGRGLFALVRLAKGTRIEEYSGERISRQEANKRYAHPSYRRRTTYLFILDRNTVIDATHSTSVARLINHSCSPNCQSVQDGSRIFIEAIQTISPGTEITYDYRLDVEHDTERMLKKLYGCRCGSAACRGLICRRPKRRRSAGKAK